MRDIREPRFKTNINSYYTKAPKGRSGIDIFSVFRVSRGSSVKSVRFYVSYEYNVMKPASVSMGRTA